MTKWVNLLVSMFLAVPIMSAQQPPSSPSTPAQPPPPPPSVKIGEPAPDFEMPYLVPAQSAQGVDRKVVRLSDFKGKQNVVLAFFVFAFSPG